MRRKEEDATLSQFPFCPLPILNPLAVFIGGYGLRPWWFIYEFKRTHPDLTDYRQFKNCLLTNSFVRVILSKILIKKKSDDKGF